MGEVDGIMSDLRKKRTDSNGKKFARVFLENKHARSAEGQTNTVECQYVDDSKENVSNKTKPDEQVQSEGDSKKFDEQRGAFKFLDSPSVDVQISPSLKEVTESGSRDDQSADTLNVSPKQKAGESPDSKCIFKDTCNSPKSVNSEFQKSSDILSDPCDFCAENAKLTCKNCDYVYCTSCLKKLHPAIGPYKQHEVTAFDKGLKTEHQRCKEHGLVAKLFCSFCEMTRCVECANNKCCLHFKGKVSDTDIELEKKKLVAALEEATTKLSVDKYKEKVNYELENIQNTALLRTEQIRQEFISFHDLLAQKEEIILHTLQQDSADRLKHIKETLEASVNNIEIEETKLTSTVTDLVQCENTARFIEEYVTAGELCSNADVLVKEFDSHWAKNCEYTHSSLLDNPFSMLLEKMELSKKLDKAAGGEFHVRFKQTTLFLNIQDEMFSITEYLDIATPPPSTIVSYLVQLLRNRQIVVQQEVNDLKDVEMNTFVRNFLWPGERFLLRITPRYQCHTGSNSFTTRRDRPVHMLIVVDHLTGVKNSRNPDRKGFGRRPRRK